MIKMQKNIRRKVLILLAMTLLTVSLLLTACSSTAGASNTGATNSGGSSTVATPGSDLQTINQQIQNGVQSIDGAQNNTDNADATAVTENGTDPQP